MKQYYLFLPSDNPCRPNIIPQQYLVLSDDLLSEADILKTIPPVQKIVSQQLGDYQTSSYQVVAQRDTHTTSY